MIDSRAWDGSELARADLLVVAVSPMKVSEVVRNAATLVRDQVPILAVPAVISCDGTNARPSPWTRVKRPSFGVDALVQLLVDRFGVEIEQPQSDVLSLDTLALRGAVLRSGPSSSGDDTDALANEEECA